MNRIFLAFVLISLGYACGEQEGHPENQKTHSEEHKSEQHMSKSVTVDSATLKMIAKTNAAVARIDPNKITYYLNESRALSMYQNMQNLTGLQRANAEVQYATEMMNAGHTDEAIALLNSIITLIDSEEINNKTAVLNAIKKRLAIAYMRKGEQENCLINHTAESCIIPISESGIHQLEEGSKNTIRLLEEILAINPNDTECQYLLNVAYMTLGQYPENVPSKYRIPPSYFQQGGDFPKFKDVSMDLNVAVAELSGGTCIDDFNGDGHLDIVASSWGFEDQIRYFENDQKGGFIDKTQSTGLMGVTGGLNLKHADYNNDGHLDFIILRGAWFFKQGRIPNSLIRNNGDGTFTDVTLESGIYSEHPTQTAVWADFNLDGHLDLFIANESKPNEISPCELYINNGNGGFNNQTLSAGLNIQGFFKGISCGDINYDGYPDLYISTLGAENLLFLNVPNPTSVTFREIAKRVGVSEPISSFPTWMFDFNNDGNLDIFVSGYSYGSTSAATLMLEGIQNKIHPKRPYIYRNNGNGTFTEMSVQMGITEPSTTMGCNFGDLDNDGFLDFYLATGEPNLFSIVPNRMYRNDKGKKFQDVTYAGGFGHIQKGHAVGFGDMDLDGDQDIYAVMGGAFEGDVYQNILYENPIGNKNNWINIKLVGTISNRSAIGAKIIIDIEENGQTRKIYHTVDTGSSFGGNSLLAEIGLGKASQIKKLLIEWPNSARTKTIIQNIPVNNNIQVTEGENQYRFSNINSTPFRKVGHKMH